MAPIEDYALIGDRHTAALVSKEGSIDWLCLPRFDSPAAFAAILGDAGNGRWLIGPVDEATTTRRYVGDSMVLETTHETATGVVRIQDSMPFGDRRHDVDAQRVAARGDRQQAVHVRMRARAVARVRRVLGEDRETVAGRVRVERAERLLQIEIDGERPLLARLVLDAAHHDAAAIDEIDARDAADRG